MKQGELEKLPMPIQQNMGTLESRIMSDIIQRIKANGEITSAADWQINRLYQMGVSKKAIKKAIGDALGLSKKEVKKLYHDTLYNEYVRNEQLYREKGHKWIPYEKNKDLQDLIGSIEEQTNKELRNITQSLGFAVPGPTGKIIHTPLLDFYQGTLDDAMMDIASGAFDYNTVLKRTIQTMTNSGLRTIDYDSGWSNRVDVAARRAVMTGFNQLQAKINEQVAKDLKTDYFEVSWHGGARPEHQVWQGRVYSKKQLETVCGLGTVTGLCGANCYHQYNAFIPGVSVRTYTDAQLDEMNAEENQKKMYNGKAYTTYEALQQQRKMETLMRKQRQDIKLLKDGKADEDDILAAKIRYRVTMGKYAEFSAKMNLPQQRDRIYMDGLGRMAGGTAAKHETYKAEQKTKEIVAFAKKQDLDGKLKKSVAKPVSSGIMEVVDVIHKSVGAKAKNYDVFNPITGELLHLAEGTRITQPKNHIIAGKGREREIDCEDWLAAKYPDAEPGQWTKEKGFGYVKDEYGEDRKVELHWYQNPKTGKVEMKVKEQLEGGIYIDED